MWNSPGPDNNVALASVHCAICLDRSSIINNFDTEDDLDASKFNHSTLV